MCYNFLLNNIKISRLFWAMHKISNKYANKIKIVLYCQWNRYYKILSHPLEGFTHLL